MSYKFYKIGKIAGVYYSCGRKSDTILVYGIGAPNVPDNGSLPDAPYILKNKVDIFVPDYIGFGRSEGVFSPQNCIKTFLTLYDKFKKGCIGKNTYESKTIRLKYKRILFVGRSLGGAYVPLLPKFNKKIKELGVLCGAVDQSEQGAVVGEETNPDFMNGIMKDFKYLYRGVSESGWWQHLEDNDGLSPMDNIKDLKGSKLFIAHGKKDVCIHYSKATNYYKKIVEYFPSKSKQFKLKIYQDGDHGPATTNKAIQDFLEWIGVE